MSQDDVVDAWQALPHRIYLDTSTLQALYDYGGVIWEGEAFQPTGRSAKDENLEEQLPSLSKIFQVNERAMLGPDVLPPPLRHDQSYGSHPPPGRP